MKAGKGLILCWIFVILLGSRLDFWYEKQFLPPADERQMNDVLIDVVGEFKTVLARYLWFRMDLFHEVLDDQGVAAERQAEVLPLLRMITLLDPSMTDSYDQVVWDLYKGQHQAETALGLLDEGLARNPRSYELTFRKALISYMEKDNQTAREFAIKGLALTVDPVQQADCLRLLYWSAKHDGEKEIQRRALSDLLKLRPHDLLWQSEMEKLNPKEVSR